ncbi:MAG: hypothetical protein K2X11_13715 [Acetobacteraceae bacterium]|nr:hypothetical protein [Acetobacteraceae bacterium]
MPHRRAALAFALATLTGCAPAAMHVTVVERRPLMTAAEAQAFFADRTRMSFMPIHGTQVAYTAPDGRVFLWYPGNGVILPGRWGIAEGASVHPWAGIPPGTQFVCFQYGPNTFNPATGAVGGQPQCQQVDIFRRWQVEDAPGDVFGLSRRATPPFVLPRERTSLAVLAAQAGLRP